MTHARCPFEVVSFVPGAWPAPGPADGMQLGRASLHGAAGSFVLTHGATAHADELG